MSKITQQDYQEYQSLISDGYSQRAACEALDIPRSTMQDYLKREVFSVEVSSGSPKILCIDLECSPMLLWGYGLFNQNFSIDMIEEDWKLLTYCAKFVGEDKVYYGDINPQGGKTEKDILQEIWTLMDEADVLLGQNSDKFDIKKLNAKFFEFGMKPYSSVQKIDTLKIAKKEFMFSSNKLGYMTEKFNTEYKKQKHEKFPGISLFVECAKDNPEAWKEIAEYNAFDVLATEELYLQMRPWVKNHINLSLYKDNYETTCRCGSTSFEQNGFAYTNISKFKKYRCTECGAEIRDRVDLVPKELKKNIKANVS